jgi:hypothetical protein
MKFETTAQTEARKRMASRKLATAATETPLNKELFAYRSLQYSSSRPPLYPIARSEDFNLRGHRRPLAWNTADDLAQNLTIIGWMIRTHLNFTSAFEFQPRTGDSEYDLYLKKWMRRRCQKQFVDVQRIWSYDSMFRIWAGLKLYYGDTIMTKAKVGRLQLFESWNIGKGSVDKTLSPEMQEAAQEEIKLLNDVGLVWNGYAVDAYGIATGDGTGNLIHRMLVPWEAAIYDGDFTKPSGMRPASRLLPAMNFARDFLDNTQFKLTKEKIASMFGMAIFRDHQLKGGFDWNYASGNTTQPGAAPQVGSPGTNAAIPYLQYEMRPGLKLELEREDKVAFLESHNPSSEWLAFSRELGRMILAAFNIPYTLYDSERANYSSMKGDRELYKQSSLEERERNRQAKAEGYDHILAGGFGDGSLELPAGIKDPADIAYHLVPRGTWLLDIAKEGKEIREQVAAGHLTNEDACDQLGTGDFYDITERLSREQQYQRDKNVIVVVGLPGHIASTDQEPAAVAPKAPEA